MRVIQMMEAACMFGALLYAFIGGAIAVAVTLILH